MKHKIKPGMWWLDPNDENYIWVVEGPIKGVYPRLYILHKYECDFEHRLVQTRIVTDYICLQLVKRYWYDEYFKKNNKTC